MVFSHQFIEKGLPDQESSGLAKVRVTFFSQRDISNVSFHTELCSENVELVHQFTLKYRQDSFTALGLPRPTVPHEARCNCGLYRNQFFGMVTIIDKPKV